MPVTTREIPTPDGRTLCVEIAGEGEPAILVHQGTPNSRHLFTPWVKDALARGASLISYDRPGYGGSSPQPGRSVADAAADTATIADAMSLDRLFVWGCSGGGPHALACAALLPERVPAVGVVASVAPWGAPGLDYFSGMGEDNVTDVQLYLEDPDAARARSRQEREELLSIGPDELAASWQSLLSPADARASTGEFAQATVRSLHDGLAPGDEGWWEDGVAHMEPWGFELESIRVPVKFWHGAQDRFVPIQHGRWLAEHVPGSEAALTEQDGHLTLLATGIPAVHEWLLARA